MTIWMVLLLILVTLVIVCSSFWALIFVPRWKDKWVIWGTGLLHLAAFFFFFLYHTPEDFDDEGITGKMFLTIGAWLVCLVLNGACIWKVYTRGLDGSSLAGTRLKEPAKFKPRKRWSRMVEEFNAIHSAPRRLIKVNGMDYVEYARKVCGLAPDDPYYLRHRDKAMTGYDRDQQVLRELRYSDTHQGYDRYDTPHHPAHTSHQANDYEFHPDEWRRHIPYSDIWDSHLSNTAPDYLDRDGDGYRDGSVGDSGLFDA